MIKTGIRYSIPFYVILIGFSVYGWIAIPEGATVPSHWNIHGEIDRTTNRMLALLLIPAMSVLVITVLALIPVIEPRRKNIQQSKALYFAAWFGTLAILTVAHAMMIVPTATGMTADVRWLIVGTAILNMLIGNFMTKSRSTFFIGLRTPWTLSSEHAWGVAHRITGWAWVLSGLVTIVITYARGIEAGLITLIAGLLAGALAGVFASYFAWRSDPERQE